MDACSPFFEAHLLSQDGKRRDDANVIFTNGKGAFSDSLAEYTLAAALHFNKLIPKVQANKAEKKWEKFVMPTISGKTIGFLGFGHIARCTAKAAKAAFNMRVVASRRNPQADSEGLADVVYSASNMERVFEESDFVVSVLPGTPETVNLITDRHFDKMKTGAVFISIGRGVVVDEDALVRALQSGKIAGAALDVFQVEPLPQDHPLWECENVLITSHNADFTGNFFQLGWEVWSKNMDAFARGEQLVTEIDPAAGY